VLGKITPRVHYTIFVRNGRCDWNGNDTWQLLFEALVSGATTLLQTSYGILAEFPIAPATTATICLPRHFQTIDSICIAGRDYEQVNAFSVCPDGNVFKF
jgi:hypothetical protein